MSYYKINDIDFIIKKNIPELPGIYKIIALDINGLPLVLNRFLGFDNSGTLYIGKAENLCKRLTNMKRAFSPNHISDKHIAVRRYKMLNTLDRMTIQFPMEKIVIEIQLAKNMTARELESKAFRDYEELFGERPPLNRQ